jgi:aminopyrrolnitrin oxygenase
MTKPDWQAAMVQLTKSREHCERSNLPDARDFPARPTTWYLFCRSRDLSAGPLSKVILQRRLVAYRTTAGRVSVLDAACAHLGADLGRGRVVGDEIECPYHQWKYSSHGRCVRPHRPDSVTTPRLRSYPVVERHGYVFFFFGPRPLFPLPFFSDCDPTDFLASATFVFEASCSWFMLTANAFDSQHFHAVHDRKLLNDPHVDCPADYARRMRFDAEIVGTSIFDRLLKTLVGKRVSTSITSWGGPFVLVEGIFGKAHSRLLVASQPLDENRTLCEVMAFARKSRGVLGPVVNWANLKVRRRFTQAFLKKDTDKLSGIRYQPQGLTADDGELIAYFNWLTTLPRSEYETHDGCG